MSLADHIKSAVLRGQMRRVNYRPRDTRRNRTPWAGPDLPVTWFDGTDVLPEGGYSFGDNPTTRKASA